MSQRMQSDAAVAMPRWSIALIAARESAETLHQALRAAVTGCPVPAAVDVLVNGNPQLATDLAQRTGHAEPAPGVRHRIWHLPLRDKSNAWNVYLHEIWPGADVAFFIDGYVRVQTDALARLADALHDDAYALAAAAVPSVGPSAPTLRAAMLREGGLHGNLHAIRGDALARLRGMGFRIPVGLYRSDGLIGAAMCFGLDPTAYRWDARRIRVVTGATWTYDPPSYRRIADVKAALARRTRQAQGRLESAAIRQLLDTERRPLASLPATAAELIAGWRRDHAADYIALTVRDPGCLLAARRLRAADAAIGRDRYAQVNGAS